MAKGFDDIGVLTTTPVRAYIKAFLEILNGADHDAFQTLRPYIKDNAAIDINLTMGNEGTQRFQPTPEKPKTLDPLKGLLSGFVEIHGVRISSDVRSAAGKVTLHRASDLFFDGVGERTESGLIYEVKINCGFQMALTRERTLQLTRFTCK